MTRARVKALHDKVNSLLCSHDFDLPLDGILPYAPVLCILSYDPNGTAQARGKGMDGFKTSSEEEQASEAPAVVPPDTAVLPP